MIVETTTPLLADLRAVLPDGVVRPTSPEQVVTGTGELVRLGRRTAEGVAGMDLCSLFVGSQGTLG